MEGVPSAGELRCPTCNKLLAMRLGDGSYEVHLARRFKAVIRDGDITCVACWQEVPCRPPAPDVQLTFGRYRRG